MTKNRLTRKVYKRLIGIANGKEKKKKKRWSKRWHHCSESVASQNDKHNRNRAQREVMIDTMNRSQIR